MPQNNIPDKQILYSLITREISNILRGIPILSLFEDTIVGFILQLIDPYVNEFIDENNKINSEQLSKFVSQEVKNKIQAFKKDYEEIKDENKNNF